MTNQQSQNIKVSIDLLKKLREETQLGYTDCQKALVQAKNDKDKALLILNSKSLIAAGKRLNRKIKEGTIASYIHKSPKLSPKEGVLIQLGCETSFVANLNEFTLMAQNIARAIYQYKPKYLYFEDIPSNLWLEKFQICFSAIKEQNPNLSLIEQKQQALFQTRNLFESEVLMCQKFDFQDQDFQSSSKFINIQDYIANQMAILKENIKISRFIVFQI